MNCEGGGGGVYGAGFCAVKLNLSWTFVVLFTLYLNSLISMYWYESTSVETVQRSLIYLC